MPDRRAKVEDWRAGVPAAGAPGKWVKSRRSSPAVDLDVRPLTLHRECEEAEVGLRTRDLDIQRALGRGNKTLDSPEELSLSPDTASEGTVGRRLSYKGVRIGVRSKRKDPRLGVRGSFHAQFMVGAERFERSAS